MSPDIRAHSRFFAALLSLLCLAGCSGVRSVGKGQRFVPPTDPAIHYGGRWDLQDPEHPRASWPGFEVATGFSGRSIAVRLRDPGNYYNVFIDGRLHGVVGGATGKLVSYALASDLPPGPHQLRLQRRNISFDQPTTFEGFVVDEAAVLTSPPPEKHKRRVEFIGDSYTVAEGNEATAETLPWKEKYPVTNFELGYAAEVARGLDAELTAAVCRSGLGLVCDFTGYRKYPMTERFGWALMEDPNVAWDFSRDPHPDLVIVSLGLNDHTGMEDKATGQVSAAHTEEFRAAYHRMLAIIREKHPQAKIVALAPYVPWVRDNVREVLRTEPGVYYAQFDQFPGGYVADGHPTVATHRLMAAQILKQLRDQGLTAEE